MASFSAYTSIETNTQSLTKELHWFKTVVDIRLKNFFEQESGIESIYYITPPELDNDSSMYAQRSFSALYLQPF